MAGCDTYYVSDWVIPVRYLFTSINHRNIAGSDFDNRFSKQCPQLPAVFHRICP